MEWLKRLDSIDPRWVYVIMALSLVFPVLKPIGLAISINKETTIPVYNWIESLQPGDIVVGDVSFSGGSEGELGPQLQAWFRHCMQRGVKVIMVAQWNTGERLGYTLLEETAEQLQEEGIPCEYGVDWVYAGYKPGGTTLWRQMQLDFWEACAETDMLGNSFSDLPLMQRFKKWDKATASDLIIFAAGDPGVGTYTTYFPDYNIYVGNVAVQVPGAMNTLRAGQIKGLLAGLPGAAEYELLLDKAGKAVKLMDAQSMGHAWIMLLVILGNIGFYLGAKERD